MPDELDIIPPFRPPPIRTAREDLPAYWFGRYQTRRELLGEEDAVARDYSEIIAALSGRGNVSLASIPAYKRVRERTATRNRK